MKRIFFGRPRRYGGWKSWLAAILGGAGAAQAAPETPVAPAPPPATRAPSPTAPPVASASAPAPPAPAPAGPASSRASVVVYKTTADTKLKLHFARPAPERFPGLRPCVVFFHGGAWRSGDPKQFMAYAQKLAEVGVINWYRRWHVRPVTMRPRMLPIRSGTLPVTWCGWPVIDGSTSRGCSVFVRGPWGLHALQVIDQRNTEALGEGHVMRVVDGEVVRQLAYALPQDQRWVQVESEGLVVVDRSVRRRVRPSR